MLKNGGSKPTPRKLTDTFEKYAKQKFVFLSLQFKMYSLSL